MRVIEHLLLMMSHSSGSGINMSKLIEPLSGFLRKKEATTWTSIRIHHCPPPTKFSKRKKKFFNKKKEKKLQMGSNHLDRYPHIPVICQILYASSIFRISNCTPEKCVNSRQ